MDTIYLFIIPTIMLVFIDGKLYSGVRDLLEDKSLADCVASIADTYFPEDIGIDAATEAYVYQNTGEYSLGLEKEVYKKLHELRKFKLRSLITTGKFSTPNRIEGQKIKADGLRSRAYVVMLRKNATKTNLVEQLHMLFGSLLWIPREPWIVTVRNPDQLEPVLTKLMTAQVTHALVLLQSPGFGGVVEVYSWSMTTEVGHRCWENTGLPVLVDRWSAERKSFIKGDQLFPDRRLRGCYMLIQTGHNPPYVIMEPGVDGESVGGLEPKILSFVSQQLNFTLNYTTINSVNYGVTNLWKGVTDLVFYGVDCNIAHYQNIEFSFFYLIDKVNLYVPAGDRKPPWQSLIAEFSVPVWLLVFSVWLVVSSFIMRNSALLAWAVLLENGTDGESILNSFFILYIFYCLFVQTAYKSSLVSFLTDPGYLPPLASIREAIALNITICMATDGSLITPLTYMMYDLAIKRNKYGSMQACLNETAFQRTTVSIASEHFFRYWAPKIYRKNNRDMIKAVDDIGAMIAENVCVYHSTTFPLYNELNRELSQIVEAGFLTKWWSEIYSNLRDTSDNNVILTTQHLTAAFLVFSVGLLLALIVFMGEIIFFYLKRRIKRAEVVTAA